MHIIYNYGFHGLLLLSSSHRLHRLSPPTRSRFYRGGFIIYFYPISTLPEHLHSTFPSHAKLPENTLTEKKNIPFPSLTLITCLTGPPVTPPPFTERPSHTLSYTTILFLALKVNGRFLESLPVVTFASLELKLPVFSFH